MSNHPEFHLFRTDAVHGCPKGLADYNLNFILLFVYSKCVSLSPACDHGEKPAAAHFKYKGSLEAEPDTV